MNQPTEIVRKYGIIRDGKHLRWGEGPSAAPEGGGRLRAETLSQLQQLEEDQRKKLEGVSVESPPPKSEGREAASKMGDAEVRRIVEGMDSFDLGRLGASRSTNIFNTPEQRKAIEARLEPLDFGELVMNGNVMQRVPIIPGKFEVTFQHVEASTDLKIKEMVGQTCNKLDMGEAYALSLYALLTLAAAVVKIGDRVYPSYIENGAVSDKMLWKRFEQVSANIVPMVMCLIANFVWFDERVSDLFRVDRIKNG
jgi:hypothetical protein